MILTRRTFVQSSLAASLAVAADATRATWLLKDKDPLRIALAGLGPETWEHLALYAAIPNVNVVGIADGTGSHFSEALAQLEKFSQPQPFVSNRLEEVLSKTLPDAISVPTAQKLDFPLRDVLSIGLPVLTDTPPPLFAYKDFLGQRKAYVGVRSADLLYPGAMADISTRWMQTQLTNSDQTGERTARLVLERRLSMAQLRAVVICSLQAVLGSHSFLSEELASWSSNPEAVELNQTRTSARVYLPARMARFSHLDIDLLPRSKNASILSLSHRAQKMEMPVWRNPDSQSSLRTTMAFLNHVRTPQANVISAEGPKDSETAFAAATVIDCLFSRLR